MRTTWVKLLVVGLGLAVFPVTATTLYVDVNGINPTPPFADLTTAAVSIQDAVDAATNGDLILVNDGVYQDGFRVTQETLTPSFPPKTIFVTNRIVVVKNLTVQSLNGPSAAFISGGGTYRCVYLTNSAILSGFTLTNGVAGWISTTQSFRGSVTVTNAINGGGVAGVTMFGISSAWVSNCVLTSNMAYGNGGGAYGVNLVNCTLAGNRANSGGGAYFSALVNCIVTGNSAQTNGITFGEPNAPSVQPGGGGGLNECSAANCLIFSNNAFEGGGVYDARGLENCTIVNNSAASYGGVYLNGDSFSPYAYATNCIIYYNTAGTNANFGATNLLVDHCCTFPMPSGGVGNITNDPAFLDYLVGDFHLQTNSSCINSGNNAANTNTNTTDLDGHPRVVGGTVDIGAYEFQTPASVLSYAWARQYGLPTDGSADYVDSDGDGMSNWQEFIAGTDPTNAASVLQMTSVVPEPGLNWVVVKWQSVNTRNYYLQRSPNLAAPDGFTTIQSNIVGEAGTTITFDVTATNGGPYFYRVGVQ